jgi:hypothetical protein
MARYFLIGLTYVRLFSCFHNKNNALTGANLQMDSVYPINAAQKKPAKGELNPINWL